MSRPAADVIDLEVLHAAVPSTHADCRAMTRHGCAAREVLMVSQEIPAHLFVYAPRRQRPRNPGEVLLWSLVHGCGVLLAPPRGPLGEVWTVVTVYPTHPGFTLLMARGST